MRFLHLVFFLALLAFTNAAIMQYPATVGGRVMLDLGDYITTWGRQRQGSPLKEYIKQCKSGDKKNCGKWIDSTGKEVKTDSHSVVAANGTLIINNFTRKDVGVYFSDDERVRVTQTKDGFVGTAHTVINVVLDS